MDSLKYSRRGFLLTGAGVAAWAALKLRSASVTVEAKSEAPKVVRIVQFSVAGQRGEVVTEPMVIKTESEWKQQLTPLSYDVTRNAGTERAYSGQYWNLEEKGLFRCLCCDTALFSSSTKFDSGTGWPSFWETVAKENVRESGDFSFGVTRTAVNCRLCDAHLGHVFDDGPQPTGLRYCMNSVALKFIKSA